ncbi:MAG TPA: protein-L-isoaspartate O-methyltransferase, partial [Spirochaetia bacterium]|nr:protein-L-isoaspartate O-methyltransferase [Spirochaetia bacterium]
VERIPELAAKAEKTLDSLGIKNVTFRTGDGSPGWPEEAPFDRILVTAAAPTVPSALRAQLADNGILVVPVGDWRRSQTIVSIHRIGGSFISEESIGCRFVPLIGEGGFTT